MRKVLIARPGGYERLEIVEAPEVRPGPGELRIAVKAIGVNYADCVVRMGLYASAKEFVGWPIVPGFEVAGVVDAVGEGVTRWAVGSPVVAVTRFGGYATSLCVPEHQVFAIPAGLSFAEIAGVPAVYMTAWYALHALAHAPHDSADGSQTQGSAGAWNSQVSVDGLISRSGGGSTPQPVSSPKSRVQAARGRAARRGRRARTVARLEQGTGHGHHRRGGEA